MKNKDKKIYKTLRFGIKPTKTQEENLEHQLAINFNRINRFIEYSNFIAFMWRDCSVEKWVMSNKKYKFKSYKASKKSYPIIKNDCMCRKKEGKRNCKWKLPGTRTSFATNPSRISSNQKSFIGTLGRYKKPTYKYKFVYDDNDKLIKTDKKYEVESVDVPVFEYREYQLTTIGKSKFTINKDGEYAQDVINGGAVITAILAEKDLGNYWHRERCNDLSQMITRLNIESVLRQNGNFLTRPNAGLMTFKSWYNSPLSFKVEHHACFDFDTENMTLWIQKINDKKNVVDRIKVRGENKKYPNGIPKSLVLEKDRADNKWYIYVTYEVQEEESGNGDKTLPVKVVGIDWNAGFLVTSCGIVTKKVTEKHDARIDREQSKYSVRQNVKKAKKDQIEDENKNYSAKNLSKQRSKYLRQHRNKKYFLKRNVIEDLVNLLLKNGTTHIAIWDMDKERVVTKMSKTISRQRKKDINRKMLGISMYKFEQFWLQKWDKWDAKNGKVVKDNSRIIRIDPTGTTHTCYKCKYIDSANRGSFDNNNFSWREFKCKKCGYEQHADINTALNIRHVAIEKMSAEKN